jgi:hypothetical protein
VFSLWSWSQKTTELFGMTSNLRERSSTEGRKLQS